jgi:hypothetical protein
MTLLAECPGDAVTETEDFGIVLVVYDDILRIENMQLTLAHRIRSGILGTYTVVFGAHSSVVEHNAPRVSQGHMPKTASMFAQVLSRWLGCGYHTRTGCLVGCPHALLSSQAQHNLTWLGAWRDKHGEVVT